MYVDVIEGDAARRGNKSRKTSPSCTHAVTRAFAISTAADAAAMLDALPQT